MDTDRYGQFATSAAGIQDTSTGRTASRDEVATSENLLYKLQHGAIFILLLHHDVKC
jgi:hypothetical protein